MLIELYQPVAAHTAGIIFASSGYILWAALGKLLTGHSGLFFLDPELMGEQWEAVFAAIVAWLTLAPGSKLIKPATLVHD